MGELIEVVNEGMWYYNTSPLHISGFKDAR